MFGKKGFCPAQSSPWTASLYYHNGCLLCQRGSSQLCQDTCSANGVWWDDYKLNTAEEVEERAEKAKDLNYTFTVCRRLPTWLARAQEKVYLSKQGCCYADMNLTFAGLLQLFCLSLPLDCWKCKHNIAMLPASQMWVAWLVLAAITLL